jgi:opacity protein-like surface antigen
MRRFLFLLMVVFAVSITANAQDFPKVEVHGTYSLLVADIDVLDDETLHGYGFGIAFNPHKNFGLVAEFTSNHGASGPVTIPEGTIPELDTRVYSVLFGPRLSARYSAVTVFGHGLLGWGNMKLENEKTADPDVSESNTEFTMAIGGGLDINVAKHVAIRAAQLDYMPIHTDINTRLTGGTSSWLHNLRYQAGIVFKF